MKTQTCANCGHDKKYLTNDGWCMFPNTCGKCNCRCSKFKPSPNGAVKGSVKGAVNPSHNHSPNSLVPKDKVGVGTKDSSECKECGYSDCHAKWCRSSDVKDYIGCKKCNYFYANHKESGGAYVSTACDKYERDSDVKGCGKDINRSYYNFQQDTLKHLKECGKGEKIRHCQRWTKKEDDLLLAYYPTMKIRGIAQMLGRSYLSITNRISNLITHNPEVTSEIVDASTSSGALRGRKKEVRG